MRTSQEPGRFLIKPLIVPQVDIKLLATVIRQVFKHDVESDKFIGIMAELFQPDLGHYRHLTYGFLVACDTDTIYDFISSCSELHLHAMDSRGQSFCVISGHLKQWRETIVCCMQPHVSEDVKELANGFLWQFDQLGISPLFKEYRRNGDLTLSRKD